MKKLIVIAAMMLSAQAWASAGTEVGILFGAKNAEFDTDQTGTEMKSTTGMMAGVIAYGEMGGMLFRTGGYYAERKAELEVGALKADLKLAYLDVPVTVMHSFNEMFSVFGGALFALKMNDDCEGDSTICNTDAAENVKSFHAALTFGLNAKFHPNWSGEIFYEHGLNEITDDTNVTALSAAVVFAY